MTSCMPMFTIALILGEGLSLESGASPGDSFSKVEKETYAALSASPDDRVYVLINLAPPGRNGPYPTQAVKDRQQEVLDSLGGQGFELGYRFKTFAGLTGRITGEGLDRLASHRSVVSVGLDRRGRLAADARGGAARNDYIEATRAHEELGISGRGVTVAVIDTGVNTTHPDLFDNIAAGAYHFTGSGRDVGPGVVDTEGHGTMVASIITGKWESAPRGIAPDADVLPISIWPDPSASDLTAAIDYVVSHKNDYAKLAAINISLGFASYSTCPCDEADAMTRMFQSAILAAKEAGILCFVATGNDDSCDSMYSPGCTSAANSVGSVRPGKDGTLLSLGNRNGCLTLSAPGELTSWTAPQATALAALMSQADSCASETAETVVGIMKETGTPVSRRCGGDVESTVINAFRAVSAVLMNQTTGAQVARDLSQETHAPGEAITVHLTVTPDSPDADISVVEFLPGGVEASEISDGGIQIENRIRWTLRSSSTRTLSYKLFPVPCAGDLVFGRSCVTGPGLVSRAPGAPSCSVTREFTEESYRQGDTIEVSLTIAADRPGTECFVEEILPDKTRAIDISDSGVATGKAIRWSLSGISTKTLSYRLSMSPCTGDLIWQGNFVMGALNGQTVGKSLLKRAQGDQELGPWENVDVATTGGFTDRLGPKQVFVHSQGGGVRQSRDEFRFVHLPHDGDFQLSARIDCFDASAGSAQAGLMVRDTLEPFSANVFFYISLVPTTGALNLRALYRRETKSERNTSPIVLTQRDVPALPIFLKIQRTGASISLQRSVDGSVYTEVATKEIGMGTTQVNLRSAPLIGLAVSGGADSARAIFSGFDSTAPAGAAFHRGDPNASGTIDISDGIAVFGFLFLGDQTVDCKESADANNDGTIDISDGIYLLSWLFIGGPEPVAPGHTGLPCGLDPDPPGSPGDLGCEAYVPCGN